MSTEKQIRMIFPGDIPQVDYVVSVSGGLTSFEALRRTIESKGRENVCGVFADVGTVEENGEVVSGEDADLHRFLAETEALLDFPIYRIRHRKYTSVWDAFFGERFMGNSMIDTCSKFLKREVLDHWIGEYHPGATWVLGYSWLEADRAKEFRNYFPNCHFPLTEPPYVTNEDIALWLEARGVQRPRNYREGFSHNNCGGFCVKGGLGQMHDLWRLRPRRYEYNERKEQEFRALVNPEATIFRKSEQPITLEELRILFEGGYTPRTAGKGESCGGKCCCRHPTTNSPSPDPRAFETTMSTEWKPIETAPQDGTAILLYLEKAVQKSHYHTGWIHPNVSVIGGHFAFDMPKATHWMPLPEPPPRPGLSTKTIRRMNCPFCNKPINAMTGIQEAMKFQKHLGKCRKNPNNIVLNDGRQTVVQPRRCQNLTDALEIRHDSGQ